MKYGYTIIYVPSVEETLEFYKRAFLENYNPFLSVQEAFLQMMVEVESGKRVAPLNTDNAIIYHNIYYPTS